MTAGAKARLGVTAALVILGTACSSSPSPATSAPTSSAAAAITLQQGAGGLVFTPAALTVKQGQTIAVSNVGSASHTFTITGQGVDVVNTAGQSQDITIALSPGTYPFICRFHVSLGMKGTLTVTS